MKSYPRAVRCVVPCFALGALAQTAVAQDSLRTSLNGQNAVMLRTQQVQDQPYTVRFGDFTLLTSASAGVDYNDNVTLVHSNPRSDVILLPNSNIDARWPITELNALSFSLGVGYEDYLRYSQYSRALITPGSQLSWDFFIKNFKINVHDQFSYEQDPTASGEITSSSSYGGFYNTLGFSTMWDLQDVVLSSGYDHFNFFSSSSKYEYLNRASDFAWARAGIKVHPSATVGFEVSGGPTTYDQRIMSDNKTYSFGVFADWKITEHIKVEPRGGYYLYYFDNNGLNSSSSDQAGYYFSLKLTHYVNQYIRYSVEGGRETFFGVASALTEQMYGSAYINWNLIRKLNLRTEFRYEDATQPIAYFTESYDRMYASIRLSYPLGDKLTANVDYRYWIRQSQLSNILDYEQNRIGFNITYRF